MICAEGMDFFPKECYNHFIRPHPARAGDLEEADEKDCSSDSLLQ